MRPTLFISPIIITEPTIRNLLENFVYRKNICLGLDSQSNANWEKLLEILNERSFLGESFQFESCYHSGGSPTMAMFEVITMRWPRHSLSDLKAKLVEIQQNDLVLDLTKIMKARNVKLLKDLKIDEKQNEALKSRISKMSQPQIDKVKDTFLSLVTTKEGKKRLKKLKGKENFDKLLVEIDTIAFNKKGGTLTKDLPSKKK